MLVVVVVAAEVLKRSPNNCPYKCVYLFACSCICKMLLSVLVLLVVEAMLGVDLGKDGSDFYVGNGGGGGIEVL